MVPVNNPPDWGSGEEFFGPRHSYRLHLIMKLCPKVPCLCLDAACGLGTLSEEEAERAIGLTAELSGILRMRHGGQTG